MALLQSPVTWMLLCVAGMALGFWWGVQRLHVARTIDNTPVSRVRSAAQGYVALSGSADSLPGEVPRAPLTLLPSVWWHYHIEERTRDANDDRRGWRTVSRATSEQNFVITDATGQCVIDPEGAQVYPSVRQVWYGSNDWPAPGLGSTGVISSLWHRYRYTEQRIPLRSELHVMGEFRSITDAGQLSLDAEVAELLRRWKSDQGELLRRFDTNRDGVISAAEWEQARQTARTAVLRERVSAPPSAALQVLMRPTDDRPFLIAGVDPRGLARHARWQALAAWSLFVASCAGLAWLLTAH